MSNRTNRPFDFRHPPPHTNGHTSYWFAIFLSPVTVSLRSEEEEKSTHSNSNNNLYASEDSWMFTPPRRHGICKALIKYTSISKKERKKGKKKKEKKKLQLQ